MTSTSKVNRGGSVRFRLPHASASFWALAFFLVACIALGGSARGDVASLIVLRPLAVLMLGFGLWRLQARQIKAHRFLCGMAFAILAVPIMQLVPLPPALWNHLPGRGLVMEIDQVAGIGQIWRPLSLTPAATWNAFYATLVPFAVLILGIQLGAEEQRRLLVVAIFLCGFSALLGLIQILGDPNSALYFYNITNNGSAVGLFANRNHQALLLAMMLPMLAVLARGNGPGGTARRLAAITAGLVLLPLILITGSRSGLLVAAMALLAIPFILGRDRPVDAAVSPADTRWSGRLPFSGRVGLLLAGAGLVILTVWLGRDLAWDRLQTFAPAEEIRAKLLPTLVAMILAYAPTGSGMGSFERIYQVHEPDSLLNPDYMNHAHNDWLEIMLNGGAAAGLLLIVALIGLALGMKRAFFDQLASSTAIRYSRLGLVLVLLVALASAFDYPLRVPSLAALFAIAVLWASCSLPKKQPIGAAR